MVQDRCSSSNYHAYILPSRKHKRAHLLLLRTLHRCCTYLFCLPSFGQNLDMQTERQSCKESFIVPSLKAEDGFINKIKRGEWILRTTRNLCHKHGSISQLANPGMAPLPPNAHVLQYDWPKLGAQYEDSWGT